MVLLELARRAARGLLAWRRPAVLVPVLAGMLGAAAAVGLFARQDARVGPLTVRLAARPSLHPSSMLMVPPFGSVSARTHLGLLAFRATLDNVDVPSLERLIRRYAKGDDQSLDSLQAALAPYERRARAATRDLLLRMVAVGLLGGAATSLLLRERSLAQAQRCVIGGLLGVGLMLVPALLTFRVSAFETPEFTGALQYAPALVGDVRTFPRRLDTLRQEMARIAPTSTAPTRRSASQLPTLVQEPRGSCTSRICTSTRPGSISRSG